MNLYFATEYKIEEVYIQRGPVAEVRNKESKNNIKSEADNKDKNKNNNMLLCKERRQKCRVGRFFIELLD